MIAPDLARPRATRAPRTALVLLWALVVLLSVAPLATPWYALAPLPALGAVAFLVVLRYPIVGLGLVICLIPFGGLRALVNDRLDVNVYHLAVLLVFAAVLLRAALERRHLRELRCNLWPLLGLFVLVNAVSTTLSPYPDRAHGAFAEIVAAGVFITLVLMVVDGRAFRRTVPALLIASVSVSGLLAIAGFFLDIDILSKPQADGSFRKSSGGAYDHNSLALMVICVIPLIAHRFFHARDARERTVNAGLFVLMLVTIVVTYSRSGALAVLVVLALVGIEHRHRFQVRQLGVVLAGGALLLGAFAAAVPASFWQWHASLAQWEDSSLNRRGSYLSVAAEAVPENPVLGTGPDTFREIYYQSDAAKENRLRGEIVRRKAHNTYVEVLVGTGLVGFAVFVAIVWRTIRNFLRAASIARAAGEEELASLIGAYRLFLIGFLIYAFVFSATLHKFLLLALPLSTIALRTAATERGDLHRESFQVQRDAR